MLNNALPSRARQLNVPLAAAIFLGVILPVDRSEVAGQVLGLRKSPRLDPPETLRRQRQDVDVPAARIAPLPAFIRAPGGGHVAEEETQMVKAVIVA